MAQAVFKNFARQDGLYNARLRYVYVPTTPSFDLELEIGPISLDECEKRSLSDEGLECECSRTDEIYNLIVDNLKTAEVVAKIVMAVPNERVFRIWTVVDREDKSVCDKIYEREIAIIESLSVFDVDVDFHVVTEDMMNSFVDDDAMVIYSRPPVGRQA